MTCSAYISELCEKLDIPRPEIPSTGEQKEELAMRMQSEPSEEMGDCAAVLLQLLTA